MEWEKLLCPTRVRQLRAGGTEEVDPAETRTPFERDYDRAVFSTPVRRMQDKTQVFPLDPSDFVRTRLTHSLEVSTLARGLARRVTADLLGKKIIDASKAQAIETIAATCGLIHDLGNPPFGHAGEKAISEWFAKRFPLDDAEARFVSALSPKLRADFEKFEGNAQTLRLVSRLQVLVDDTGLNLTAATLSALMKYTAAAHEADAKSPRHDRWKPGFFSSEADLVALIREHTGTGSARHPIAYLVEACDDIAYSTLDFEDGIKKGICSWRDAKQYLERVANELGCQSVLDALLKKSEGYIDRAAWPPSGKAKDEAYAASFRTNAIRQAIADVAAAFLVNYDQIMSGEFEADLIEASGSSALVESLKQTDRSLFYVSDETLRLELLGRRIIGDLLELFFGGICWTGDSPPKPKEFAGKIYALTSANYRNVFRASLEKAVPASMPDEYVRLQLVTDYICGMTDTFARTLHKRLFNG